MPDHHIIIILQRFEIGTASVCRDNVFLVAKELCISVTTDQGGEPSPNTSAEPCNGLCAMKRLKREPLENETHV